MKNRSIRKRNRKKYAQLEEVKKVIMKKVKIQKVKIEKLKLDKAMLQKEIEELRK